MNLEFDLTVTLSLILSFGTLIFAWFRTRRRDVDGRFDGIGERFTAGSKRMDALELGLRTIEQTVEMMPNKDDHHRLEISLTQLVGKMDTVGAHIKSQADLMKRMEAMVDRHEDHLLDGGNKK